MQRNGLTGQAVRGNAGAIGTRKSLPAVRQAWQRQAHHESDSWDVVVARDSGISVTAGCIAIATRLCAMV